MTDSRLYDIFTNLTVNQPTAATQVFREMLGERVEQKIAEYAKNYTLDLSERTTNGNN